RPAPAVQPVAAAGRAPRPAAARVAVEVNNGREGESAIDWNAELALGPDIQVRPGAGSRSGRPSRALLTGATGFLGAFLLNELLRQTEMDVVCLVRGTDATDCLGRIRDNLETYGLWDERHRPRIEALPGDLSQPWLRLAEAEFRRLGERIDV